LTGKYEHIQLISPDKSKIDSFKMANYFSILLEMGGWVGDHVIFLRTGPGIERKKE
jgi:hypothetical protein